MRQKRCPIIEDLNKKILEISVKKSKKKGRRKRNRCRKE